MKRLTILWFITLALGLAAQAQELKVISFNIRYNSWNNIDGENGWPNRKAAVVKMILEERPAAIGLQEALIDQLQYLDSNLSGYRRIGVGRDDGREAGEFMAIYYDTNRLSADMELCTTLWLSETPWKASKGWDAACYRTVTYAFLTDKKSSHSFRYFNTHLDHRGAVARAESAKYIAQLVKETEGFPVIVGGDMNSTIEDTIFRAFYTVGLQPARELTTVTSHQDTYNAYGKDKSSLIDHFFVSGLKIESFRTLDGDYGVPYISDHYPIEIVIKLQ